MFCDPCLVISPEGVSVFADSFLADHVAGGLAEKYPNNRVYLVPIPFAKYYEQTKEGFGMTILTRKKLSREIEK